MPPQTSTQECSIDEDEDYILGDGTELPFQIEKVLGQGSSAIVEKVRDTKTGYVFALKSMNFSRARDKPRAEEKFKREVSVIRCLRGHHHIIRLYATFAAKRRFGLILQPAAEEGNLEQYLGVYWDAVEEPAGSNLDIAEMTLVLEQAFGCLANGLAFMHANEIRHKDIKPQNILVHQGSVIYTDFGSAKDGKQCGSNTTEGPTEFTRRYAPPEVLEQGHRNFGADVYCLGCVFLEILAAVSQMISVDIDYRETQFIHMLDEVHDELAIVTMPPKLSCLPALIMSMTVRDRTKRPRADVVFANMTPDSGLFCEECSKTHREAKRLTPWTWSSAHGRHFCNMLGDKDDLLGRVWSEPANHSETSSSVPMTYHVADLSDETISRSPSSHGIKDTENATLPKTPPKNAVPGSPSHLSFFVAGRVFSMLWTEPASGYSDAQSSPNSSPDYYQEQAYSEIKTFVVVRNKGTFSQCLPIQPYSRRATGKAVNQGLIYTSTMPPPNHTPNDRTIDKAAIRVEAVSNHYFSSETRIHYGKLYTVEHNVQVKDLGMVTAAQIELFLENFRSCHVGEF